MRIVRDFEMGRLFWIIQPMSKRDIIIEEGSERDLTLLPLKTEEVGGYKPRITATSRCWQRQGNKLFSRVSRKKCNPSDTLIYPGETGAAL